MSNLLVSVALCTYNGEKYIEALLKSLIEQTKKPDEIIVCDDDSKDNTVEIVKRVLTGSGIPFYIHVNSPRLGFIKNYEKATLLCSKDIIFWCDQDDVWLPTKIQEMIEPFESDDACVYVFCDAIITDENLSIIENSLNQKFKINQKTFDKEILPGHYPYGCEIALRKNAVTKWTPFSPVLGHDHFVARCAKATGNVVEIPKSLMLYRRHKDAVTYAINNEKKKKGTFKRVLERIHRIKSVDKSIYFDNPLLNINIIEKNLYQTAASSPARQELLSQLNLQKRLLVVIESPKIKAIYNLIISFCKGEYRSRGNFKALIQDIGYIIMHD